jgi:hypothetical protein
MSVADLSGCCMRRRLKGWDHNIRRWLGRQSDKRKDRDRGGRQVEGSRRRDPSSTGLTSPNQPESLFAPVLTNHTQDSEERHRRRHNAVDKQTFVVEREEREFCGATALT